MERKTMLSSEIRTKQEKASEDAHKFWAGDAEMLKSWYMFSIIQNEERSSLENEECGGGAAVSERVGKM